MPIFRINKKLIYYVHVPKTGGTSVANFLERYADSTAFIFSGQWKQSLKDRWSFTSPQHISAANLSELFPENFFDYSFAVVRHPEDRIISEYKFRIERSRIHAALPFSDWLRVVLSATKINAFVFDGHLRPQVDFIPPNTEIFKLEDGFNNLTKWMASILDIEESKMQFDVHSNKSKEHQLVLSTEDRELIQEFYAADYKKFGYQKRNNNNLPDSSLLQRAKGSFFGLLSNVMTRLLSWRIPY